MIRKIASSVIGLAFAASLSAQTMPTNANRIGMEMDAHTFTRSVKMGWNLGDTFECAGAKWDDSSYSWTDITIPDYNEWESAWGGNPKASKKMIQQIKKAGFNAIRIPVRWVPHISNYSTMAIESRWINRIKEIVDYCLAEDMLVIINTHHESWMEHFPYYNKQEELQTKLGKLWTNIATYFRDYDGRLAFAGLNEMTVNWKAPTDENNAVTNALNQTFVNAVRATKGKNLFRNLIVQTYACDPNYGLMGFTIPNDPTPNRLSVEFHFYQPYTYCSGNKDSYLYWGQAFKEYGTICPDGDESVLKNLFKRIREKWYDKGLGVIIGEYGVSHHFEPANRAIQEANEQYYMKNVVSEARKNGFATFVWDNNQFGNGNEKFGIFDRNKGMKLLAPHLLQGIKQGAESEFQPSEGEISYMPDLSVEKRIETILSKMTLQEKIGQMTELAIDILGHWENGNFILDENKLERVFGKYKVGSILSSPGPVAQTPEKWQEIIRAINDYSIKACGIPCVYGLDQNHGTTYTIGGTLFPQNINVGASFNPTLARQAASITAYETRAANCPWTYSPTVDLSRDPRWPRVWENFGEDCLVNSVMGEAMIKGFQGENPNNIDKFHIGTSVKHFMAYGSARTGKDRTPTYVPEWELREKHFAPFLACVKAGATSIMVNSGSVNGIPMHVNAKYLTKWLKEETGWDGMIVTDWADIDNLWKREMVAIDKKDAIRLAINAGIDMSMDPYDTGFCDMLAELVNEGKVSMERIDDAVRRVLRMKCRMGLFDNPNTNLKDYPKFGSAEHAKVTENAAVESMVLLKNTGILPLSSGKKILVTGPNANSMRSLNGGWSYTWQGKDADKFAEKHNTIYEALADRFGKENVVLESGVTYNNEGKYWEENVPEIERAVSAAKDADIIIACVGENSYTETPGNLDDLALSENQRSLVKALAKTGKPIVLILNEGRPRLIADIEPLASAVVDIFLPGNMGGNALARLLAGDDNFSGRMPYTYPRYSASLTTYDFRVSEQIGTMEGAYDYNALIDVQWPFGYGLSYTNFEYSNMKVDKSIFSEGDTLTITIDVKNTGIRAGKESTLLYSRDVIATIVPENRRLRAFSKNELKTGESKTVTFTLPASALAFVGDDGKRHLEKGDFILMIGNQSAKVHCQ